MSILSDDEIDQWARLDELLGLEALAAGAAATGGGIGRLAFCGRCSTEDNQDPKTSHAWQLGEAQRLVEPLGGEIVAEYFDIGESRSLPWEGRSYTTLLDATPVAGADLDHSYSQTGQRAKRGC